MIVPSYKLQFQDWHPRWYSVSAQKFVEMGNRFELVRHRQQISLRSSSFTRYREGDKETAETNKISCRIFSRTIPDVTRYRYLLDGDTTLMERSLGGRCGVVEDTCDRNHHRAHLVGWSQQSPLPSPRHLYEVDERGRRP